MKTENILTYLAIDCGSNRSSCQKDRLFHVLFRKLPGQLTCNQGTISVIQLLLSCQYKIYKTKTKTKTKVIPEWSQSGPRTAPEWSQSGSRVVIEWT